MHKGTILYIGGFKLPDKNAAAHRVMANAKIFKEAGYKTIFLGISNEKEANSSVLETKKYYEGFESYTTSYPTTKKQWIRHLSTISTVKEIIKKQQNIKFLICYNYPAIALLRLKKFAEKNGIKLISDCTEWYGSIDENAVMKSIKSLDTYLRMQFVNKQVDGLIVVSKYLQNHYKNKKNLLIPTLLNQEKIDDIEFPENNIITFAYAGIPFRMDKPLKDIKKSKDRLDVAIIYLHQMHLKGYKFIFNVYGLTKTQYYTAIPESEEILKDLESKIFFHGFMNSEELKKEIQRADFTILLRDKNRVAMSGFPTKFTESIINGTPVITTKTSDLEDYLIEGENGFFIDITQEEEALLELEKIIQLDKKNIKSMKKNCIKNEMFNNSNWINEASIFFEKIGS